MHSKCYNCAHQWTGFANICKYAWFRRPDFRKWYVCQFTWISLTKGRHSLPIPHPLCSLLPLPLPWSAYDCFMTCKTVIFPLYCHHYAQIIFQSSPSFSHPLCPLPPPALIPIYPLVDGIIDRKALEGLESNCCQRIKQNINCLFNCYLRRFALPGLAILC